ncbi:MAG: hypothetical protein DI551_05915 [Micavibrio aeruginosavorus]|uniref:Uncharacterized protein n=1 Tax=Micavibrio aeruginosavorus TaxID=349221 RepID=A0A2W5PU92_9BACT|nr:MAG: hypothetical protein DI551_05915 [Micavibrio aeruginosavorus]
MSVSDNLLSVFSGMAGAASATSLTLLATEIMPLKNTEILIDAIGYGTVATVGGVLMARCLRGKALLTGAFLGAVTTLGLASGAAQIAVHQIVSPSLAPKSEQSFKL